MGNTGARSERLLVSLSGSDREDLQRLCSELNMSQSETFRFLVRERLTKIPYLLESRDRLEHILDTALKNQAEAFHESRLVEEECRLLQKELHAVYMALNILDKEERERFEKERERILSETGGKMVSV